MTGKSAFPKREREVGTREGKKYTKEEEKLLIKLVEKGVSWENIREKYFPSRSFKGLFFYFYFILFVYLFV